MPQHMHSCRDVHTNVGIGDKLKQVAGVVGLATLFGKVVVDVDAVAPQELQGMRMVVFH